MGKKWDGGFISICGEKGGGAKVSIEYPSVKGGPGVFSFLQGGLVSIFPPCFDLCSFFFTSQSLVPRFALSG